MAINSSDILCIFLPSSTQMSTCLKLHLFSCCNNALYHTCRGSNKQKYLPRPARNDCAYEPFIGTLKAHLDQAQSTVESAVDCRDTQKLSNVLRNVKCSQSEWVFSQDPPTREVKYKSTKLISIRSTFSGLVFDSTNDSSSKHIKYKIRMGKDSVPITFQLKPR